MATSILKSLFYAFCRPGTALTSADDMDTLTPGVYYQQGGSTPANYPYGSNNAWIIMLRVRQYDSIQIVASTNVSRIYVRFSTNANPPVWGDWKIITMT